MSSRSVFRAGAQSVELRGYLQAARAQPPGAVPVGPPVVRPASAVGDGPLSAFDLRFFPTLFTPPGSDGILAYAAGIGVAVTTSWTTVAAYTGRQDGAHGIIMELGVMAENPEMFINLDWRVLTSGELVPGYQAIRPMENCMTRRLVLPVPIRFDAGETVDLQVLGAVATGRVWGVLAGKWLRYDLADTVRGPYGSF